MSKIWRYLKPTLLWAAVVVVSLALLLIAVNLKDAPLSPEAVSAIEFPVAGVPDSTNAYFALYGFRAPPGADPHAAGLQFVTSTNTAYARKEPLSEEGKARLRAPDALKFSGSTQKLCNWDTPDCLAVYRTNREEIRKLARANSVLLQRYRAFHRYRAFQETAVKKYTVGLPPFAIPEHALALGVIGLEAIEGGANAAVAELARDIGFWRQVLQGASAIVTKMVAAAFLDRDFALLAEIAKRHRDRPEVLSAAQATLKPLTEPERSFVEAFRGEYATQAHFILDLEKQLGNSEMGFFNPDGGVVDRVLAALFFKPNASTNLIFQRYRERLRLAEAPGDKLIGTADALASEDRKHHDIVRWDIVYNPVGKILFAISDPSSQAYARFVARLHNLDGRMRLIVLQLALYKERVPDGQIDKVLAASPAALHDPYRAAPMAWDSKRRALLFMGIGSQTQDLKLDKEIAVRL